jgi:F-type H+-transporting ATPase subunit epsilon
MKLTISQIDKVLWQGDAESVTLPATGGEMTVLAHHMPMVTTLKKGKIFVKTSTGERTEYPIESGFLEIGKEETIILV